MMIFYSAIFRVAQKYLALSALLLLLLNSTHAQKNYQSLFWKITDPKTGHTSYLYGTMHVSEKMAFYLGEPFYEAMQKSDVIALELEPEAWLEEMFDGNAFREMMLANTEEADMFWSTEAPPNLKNQFTLDINIQQQIKHALSKDPDVLNYLLFRFNEFGSQAEFEEDTWLDMHIYQTGKKFGKRTLGLETYQESGIMLKMAEEASAREKKRNNYDDYATMMELQSQLEPAYRKQDLDLIDSITKKTSSNGFLRYIIVERNKNFVEKIDSVIQHGQSIFASMGCAHLPGDEGVIAMLRNKGYIIEPMAKGDRNSGLQQKMDKQIFKRDLRSFTTEDGRFTLQMPGKTYQMHSEASTATWMSMDIPNGANYLLRRIRTYSGLTDKGSEELLVSIDSAIYEGVAGQIISQNKINIDGHPAIEIMNKTRRGDVQRKLIVVLPDEIAILKLTATGDKVQEGLGDGFFTKLKINLTSNHLWKSDDGSAETSWQPSLVRFPDQGPFHDCNLEEVASSSVKGDYYLVRRITPRAPSFLDEDQYELNRVLNQFEEDNQLRTGPRRELKLAGYPAMLTNCNGMGQKPFYALALLKNLDYWLLIAKADSATAIEFFRSFKWKNPEYLKFTLQTDSLAFFSAELPYTLPKSDANPLGIINLTLPDKAINTAEGKTVTRNLQTGNTSEQIKITSKRFSKYAFKADPENYLENRIKEHTRSHDLKVLNKKTTLKNDEGFELDLLLGDTGCTRQIRIKEFLHYSNLYSIRYCLDPVAGESDFANRLFQSFEPIDSSFQRSIFKPSFTKFLADLYSADSTTSANAADLIDEVDCLSADGPALRSALEEVNRLPENRRKQIKLQMIRWLMKDDSKANLDFLDRVFRNNGDSAEVQMAVLNTLAWMGTSESVKLLKDLLIDDPPLSNPSFNQLNPLEILEDKPDLAKLLFPEMMQLAALQEYKSAVYALMAHMIKEKSLRTQEVGRHLPTLLFEAKNEFKRKNAAGEDAYTTYSDLRNFMELLYPFRKKTDVASFFQKLSDSKKDNLLLEYWTFLLEKGEEIDEASVRAMGERNPDRMLTWYRVLQEFGEASQMPEPWNNQNALVALYAKRHFGDPGIPEEQIDSVQIIPDESLTIRGRKYDVLRLRFTIGGEEEWRGACMMLRKEQNNDPLPEEVLTSDTSFALQSRRGEDDIFKKELDKLILRNRIPRNGVVSFNSYQLDWDE